MTRKAHFKRVLLAGSALVLLGTAAGSVRAADQVPETNQALLDELDRLRGEIADQQQKLVDQQKKLFALQQQLMSGEVLVSEETLQALRGAGTGDSSGGYTITGPSAQQQAQTETQPVGEAPPEERPQVQAIAELGGVLTPRGQLVVDPQLEYSHSRTSRFFFSGVEIVEAVLIGAIEAQDERRDRFTATLGARYGITNRLEADVRVPYVYAQSDGVSPIDPDIQQRSIDGSDIGDVEFGLHYQINQGLGGWPYFVGNIRAKSNTGTGPFDVPFDDQGRQEEIPTGAGFWSVEPSVTVLYPTDPVVLYGNVGYAYNFAFDADQTVGEDFFGEVDPGNSLNFSFGMGFGINQNFSLSLGYQHNYVFSTETEVNGVTEESDIANIGSFLFGFSLALTDTISSNLNVQVGATEDAPDVRVTFSVPIAIDILR